MLSFPKITSFSKTHFISKTNLLIYLYVSLSLYLSTSLPLYVHVTASLHHYLSASLPLYPCLPIPSGLSTFFPLFLNAPLPPCLSACLYSVYASLCVLLRGTDGKSYWWRRDCFLRRLQTASVALITRRNRFHRSNQLDRSFLLHTPPTHPLFPHRRLDTTGARPSPWVNEMVDSKLLHYDVAPLNIDCLRKSEPDTLPWSGVCNVMHGNAV